MSRVAFISVHGCTFARLGGKDTGGMNVYLLRVAKELAATGVGVDIYTRSHNPGRRRAGHRRAHRTHRSRYQAGKLQ